MPPVQKRKKKDTPAASSGNRDMKAMFANHERRKKNYNVGLENICILYTIIYIVRKNQSYFTHRPRFQGGFREMEKRKRQSFFLSAIIEW